MSMLSDALPRPGTLSRLNGPPLYAYGRAVGLNLLRTRRFRRGLRCMFQPVAYWRSIEYRLVWKAANFQPSDRVLDVGSPKLLSLYLAEQVGAEVFSTDIQDYFVDEYRALRAGRGISAERLHIEVQDGRRLAYPDDSFTKAYSISVIEHIPDSGDTECIKEIGRVLAPGGECFITVPFWRSSRERYRRPDFYWAGASVPAPDGRVFYERHYSEQDLYSRLINPSGLRLRAIEYIGERFMTSSPLEIADLPAVMGPFEPLISRMAHVRALDWHELKKPLCAFMVLRKERQHAG